MTPKEVLEKWIDCFNASDVEGIAALYADDAVNHQVANAPVAGKEAIRRMFAGEFATAKMVCIVENIFESIEVLLSYVTNTMSFLRVGAFVLVHAGMMMVVFVLAETAGPIAYWPIVVVGNVIVMVLEALLVAIQVLRLEYYELFSRFYSGEGRPYEPVKLKLTQNS